MATSVALAPFGPAVPTVATAAPVINIGAVVRRLGLAGSSFQLVVPLSAISAATSVVNLAQAIRGGRPLDVTAAALSTFATSVATLNPIAAVAGTLVSLGILGSDLAEASRQRRNVRQIRREFKRKISRFAGPDVVRGAGVFLRPRAAALGRGGPRENPNRMGNPFRMNAPFGPEGFRLPLDVAVPAAIASAAGRQVRLAGVPDIDTIVRGFGIGPEADRLRQIEIDKVRGQRGALGGGRIPAIFQRRSK